MKTTLQCCALLNFEQFIQFFKPVYEMVRLLAVEAGTDDSYLDRIGSRWGGEQYLARSHENAQRLIVVVLA